MRRETLAALEELQERVRRRNALREELGVGPRPHKYLIVATGNIHDDVEQALAAAQAGADVIAVIRSTAQSLLDYVPHGATTEGYGGTYATQENFRIMREALDDESRRLRRYLHLTNYSSGLCMPEIAFAAAWERLDMLLNDAMYGILFRDINMWRTLCDQYFSGGSAPWPRWSSTPARTTTSPPPTPTRRPTPSSPASSSTRASPTGPGCPTGSSASATASRSTRPGRTPSPGSWPRRCWCGPSSPTAPIKYMPPTKHKQGDIFFSHAYDVMADVVSWVTGQSIQLLGMMTEAMHNPFLMDRYVALKGADYVHRAWRSMGAELVLRPDGMVVGRARATLARALTLLEEVAEEGLPRAIGRARFGDVARAEDGGKGLAGVVPREAGYFNPLLERMEAP